ncbi:MAG TPA: PAS domain S-box protein [Gemmatimonadaceae bacterium]|nr:PAS domain S-box protein [Gemmatimonadaceae bacterium]
MSTTSAGTPTSPFASAPSGDALTSLLARAAADAIVAMDIESRIRALNPAAERLFGGTVAELLGRSLTDLMPAAMAQRHRTGMARYLATGKRSLNWEATDGIVQRLDTGMHTPVTISFADHEENGVRLFVAVLRNRTEQQRQALALQEALAALGESERRTATILESLPVGVVVTDAEGIMSYTNLAAVSLGIETPRDDNGDPLPFFEAYSAVTGQPYSSRTRPLAQALRGATVVADDMVLRRAGGTEIPLECRATPIRNDDGEIVGAVAVVRDLRAERAAQAALRESEARYRDLVEHSGEILTSHALDGRLLSVNPAMLRSLRMRAGEVPPSLGDLVPPHHRPGFQEYLLRVQREGRADGIGSVVASDGTRRIWQFHSSIRREGVAEPVVRSIATDITDARTRERLLADRETRLRHAQKIEAVGKLAGGIAHDFNNILTVIAGHLALVRDESHLLPPQARADLEEVARAVDRATRLTRRLLGFSRKQLLAPRVVDVNSLIADLEPMLARVLDERIAFAAHPSPVPARINIDPSVLEGALLNLAVNARDAMPNGGTLTVDTTVRAKVVTIAVRDSGTGMDPETLARVGEPFFTTKGPGVGTGLGLAMIYGSVEQSGGSIQIESTPGAGTVVRLLFPVASGDTELAVEPAPSGEARAARRAARAPVRSISVLVVEDEDPLRRLVERILVREGYQVTVARHGADALHLAAAMEQPIELVITDLVMPEVGGREVAEALRARNPSLPVLFISGYDPDPVVLDASDQGNTAFLAKPFTGSALLAQVRQLAPLRGDATR